MLKDARPLDRELRLLEYREQRFGVLGQSVDNENEGDGLCWVGHGVSCEKGGLVWSVDAESGLRRTRSTYVGYR